jgi:hypothetical protein
LRPHGCDRTGDRLAAGADAVAQDADDFGVGSVPT